MYGLTNVLVKYLNSGAHGQKSIPPDETLMLLRAHDAHSVESKLPESQNLPVEELDKTEVKLALLRQSKRIIPITRTFAPVDHYFRAGVHFNPKG